MNLSIFLKSLKDASSSPYAFLGYLAVVGAWVYIARSHHRLTSITRALKDLPKNKRAELLAKEYHTSPSQPLDPEQWIRARLQMLWFAAFLSLLAVVAAIALAAVLRSQVPSGATEIPPLQAPVVDRTEAANAAGARAEVPKAADGGERSANRAGTKSPSPGEITGPYVSAKQILEGARPTRADRVFDVTISNNSKEQILLKSFDIHWGYHHGYLSAVDHGEPLKPVAEYVIKIPIITDENFPEDIARKEFTSIDQIILEDYPHRVVQTVYPSIVLPPRNDSGPSLTTIRLQLHYDFAGRINWHPCFDWDILFDLGIVDDGGARLPLFHNRWWRKSKG